MRPITGVLGPALGRALLTGCADKKANAFRRPGFGVIVALSKHRFRGYFRLGMSRREDSDAPRLVGFELVVLRRRVVKQALDRPNHAAHFNLLATAKAVLDFHFRQLIHTFEPIASLRPRGAVMAKVNVTVMFAADKLGDLDNLLMSLKQAGFELDSRLSGQLLRDFATRTHALPGTVDSSRIDRIRAIPGIDSVNQSEEFHER